MTAFFMTFSLVMQGLATFGDLGNLRVSISSEARETETEINASCIKNSRVIFTPGKQIKSMLKDLSYVKSN